MRKTLWSVLLIAMLLAACGGAESTPDASLTAEDLAGTKWQLGGFEGADPADVQTQNDQEVTLEFQADGMVSGFAGCNNFSGQYAVEDGALVITDVVSTLMACADNAVTAQEQRYLQALSTAGRFEVSGQRLTIWYADGSSSLVFARGQ